MSTPNSTDVLAALRDCGIVNGLFGQTIARFVTDGPAARQPELGEPRGIAGAARPDGTLGD